MSARQLDTITAVNNFVVTLGDQGKHAETAVMRDLRGCFIEPQMNLSLFHARLAVIYFEPALP